MNMIAVSPSQPGAATTKLATIRTTKDRAEDASPALRDVMSPAVRDAMLAAVPSLRAFAISLSHHVDRADDLVQEALMRAIASINSFQPGTNMSAWLFTILRNLFRSEYRKRRREVEDTEGKVR
jgi:DNA-directed RNA polymerase specialized sigma24 family protein